jgi:hypothetical protein
LLKKELKCLDNSFNESENNSVSKVILLIEKNIFYGNSLSRFIKRILLMKWFPLYYNGRSLVTYTNPITETKNIYLIYFWLVRQFFEFYQLIFIVKIFLSFFVIKSWLLFLVNILIYITIDKLQQLIDYNYYKDTKWLLVICWNPIQFLPDNEDNLNRGIRFKQKINKRELIVNTKFYLKGNVYLFIDSIYSNRLFKMYLLYWNSKSFRQILVIIEFTLKERLIQKDLFILEKDWNYIILDLETYSIRSDGILNELINIGNGYTIKGCYFVINQFKFFLPLIILKVVVNLQKFFTIIIGDPSYTYLLIKVIVYWLKVIYKYQCWKVKIQILLKRNCLNLFQKQIIIWIKKLFCYILQIV